MLVMKLTKTDKRGRRKIDEDDTVVNRDMTWMRVFITVLSMIDDHI